MSPRRDAFFTKSSVTVQLYAGSAGFRGRTGRCGAVALQLTVSRAMLAFARAAWSNAHLSEMAAKPVVRGRLALAGDGATNSRATTSSQPSAPNPHRVFTFLSIGVMAAEHERHAGRKLIAIASASRLGSSALGSWPEASPSLEASGWS